MTMYFFYQSEPKSVWLPALASERAAVAKDKKPALTTVLDVDCVFDEDMTAEQYAAVKYQGPLYFDIDSESIDVAIEQAKKLLILIKSRGVNLNTLRLYLTGGRGVHVLMPQATFMSKVNPGGVQHLPAIYKEMVWSNFLVDDVDTRVYSGKKGRQFRCHNVKRENGRYKVPVTADELLEMTSERYFELCASPRNEPPIEPPQFNGEIALMYSMAHDKVSKSATRRKGQKSGAELLKQFGNAWPETLQLIINGVGVKPNVGFNQIAMQVAIVGTSLGMDEDRILADSQGLIETHEGDSDRYGTPGKRRSFLREMIRYVESNPMYEYSPGGVLNLILPEFRGNSDLRVGDEWVPDEKPEKPAKAKKEKPAAAATEEGSAPAAQPETVEEEAEEPDDQQSEEEEDDNAPVRVSKMGIYVRADDGYKRACQLGMGRVTLLRKMDNSDIGYEVELFKNGQPKGHHLLTMDKFASKSAFQTWTLNWSASMSASDTQTSRLADILSGRAERNKDITYVVTREGIDLIVPPGAKSEDDFEIVWSSPDIVIGSKGGRYRYRPQMDAQGQFNSDLMNAPDLTLEDEKLIYSVLHMNTTQNMAKMLGWFTSAFMSQIFRRFFSKQFPSLQVFGQAGAGKSKSVGVLNHLHYYMKTPKVLQSVGQTQYPILAAVATSASQVVLFEELKAREMNKSNRDFLLNILRCNYDALDIARGAISRDKASRETVVNNYGNAGPVVFVGEALESQSALLERCIVVALSKQDRYGKDGHFEYVEKHCTSLGKLGKRIACNVVALNVTEFREKMEELRRYVKKQAGALGEDKERPCYNIAVVLMGLDMLSQTLRSVFGDKFDERIQEMRDSLTDNIAEHIPNNMSEAARVLDTMATLSRNSDPQYMLVQGVDYTVAADGTTVDLKLRNAYTKYVRWQRSLGMEVLFDNENAFIAGMSNYGGTLKRACPENTALYDSPKAVIYRLSTEYMSKENVDSFKDRAS